MNIVFVCQKGELELKSLLLAWSLRKTHGKEIHLIAAIPRYKDWGDVSNEARILLDSLSVEQKYFEPAFGETYPIGNKISALNLLPPHEPGCFCDSDMLSVSSWRIEDVLLGAVSAAKPADLSTWGSPQHWEKVYAITSMPMPSRRVRLTVGQTLSLPYFNAGFIASERPAELASYWADYAFQLNDDAVCIENKYPWLDQISLPMAMQKMGSWRALPEFYNYPAHLRPLADEVIGMCHYHSPNIILREPRLQELFNTAIVEYPVLKELAIKNSNWSVLVKNRLPSKNYKEHDRNLIITGIPRSGTSYVTSLLDSQKDWLVINEPGEIFELLQSRTDSSGIKQYYAECREKILLGQSIVNKVKDGVVIQDTAIVDQRESYHPEIARSDFWLGSKNTLAYMASMAYLTTLGWPIVAMVRNPLDTLASWRNTFNHLANADVENFPVANPDFPAWATWQRKALIEIAEQSDSALRRVLLWRLLAKTLIEYEKKIYLWRYEDLVADPNRLISKLNRRLGYESQVLFEAEISPRKRKNDYDRREREMLLDLCAPELSAFKYII